VSAARILLVEDEPQIRKFLRVALEANDMEVVEVATGRDGVARAATETPHLVVLDLGLPDIDGKDVVRRIREWSGIPILILSVWDREAEKVAALDLGANDYVVKPFGIAELLARVRVLLRMRKAASEDEPSELAFADLVVNLASHEVTLAGNPIQLTRKEFDLLALLARHAGRLLTHRQLLRDIWGPAHEDDLQYLRVFIGRLRQKLNDDPAAPRFILNEPGVGYRFLGE
jgi:two-component system KDP operon response regulator KdpE